MNMCQGQRPDSRVVVQRPCGHLLLDGRRVCTDTAEEGARQGPEHVGDFLHRFFNGKPSGAVAEGLSWPGCASKTKQAGVMRAWPGKSRRAEPRHRRRASQDGAGDVSLESDQGAGRGTPGLPRALLAWTSGAGLCQSVLVSC